jgi:aryl-alcohol dehydrogenase-like predicted oxidoreductase
MALQAHAVLDEAFELGIRYLDAARSYGRAEEMLNTWLWSREIEPGTLVVGSKWGYTYTADWEVEADQHEVKDHSLGTLVRQVFESTSQLGPWLGLYQVHSATLESGVLDDDSVLSALAAMADGGVAVGLSTSGPHQAEVIRRAMAVERGGQRLFRTVQSTWNLLEPSAGEALAEAHDAGLGVIVKEAVANGWLTERGVPRLPAALAEALAAADPGAGSPDQVALAAAMAQPFADVVLSGAATVDQLRSNVGALDRVASVDLDAVAGLAVDPERYWQMRSELPWN